MRPTSDLIRSEPRSALVDEIAASFAALAPRSIVAIDGVDGSGKTIFADEVARSVSRRGRSADRASVDGFHRPAAQRHARGRRSPEGFFRDSYDYDGFERELLAPFADGRPFVRAIHDVDRECDVVLAPSTAAPDAILIVDGIFLHRPELREWWTASVFLEVDFEVSIPRCAARDGGDPDPSSGRNNRYVGGQRLYMRECSPAERASLVIDNRDLAHPRILADRRR